MATYISDSSLTILTDKGSVSFRSMGVRGRYALRTDNPEIMAIIERMPSYKDGFISKVEPVRESSVRADEPESSSAESGVDVVLGVRNARQALDWLVEHRGERKRVLSKSKIRELAVGHGVEFPDWPED